MDGKTLLPISIVTNGDMSASITSSVALIPFGDNVGIQLDWAGAPVGTVAVQVSLNYSVDPGGTVLNAGTWNTLPTASFTGTYPVPGTTTSPGYLDIPMLSAKAIRVVYTRTSGTGTLNVLLICKGI